MIESQESGSNCFQHVSISNIIKIVVLILSVGALAGCDKTLYDMTAQYLKASLIDTCGESDPDCISAVKNQFDSCHKKYEKTWYAYMHSSASKEDKLLAAYSTKLYACIVDKDGNPYFIYDLD